MLLHSWGVPVRMREPQAPSGVGREEEKEEEEEEEEEEEGEEEGGEHLYQRVSMYSIAQHTAAHSVMSLSPLLSSTYSPCYVRPFLPTLATPFLPP